jgi:hypothetical protein
VGPPVDVQFFPAVERLSNLLSGICEYSVGISHTSVDEFFPIVVVSDLLIICFVYDGASMEEVCQSIGDGWLLPCC